MLLISGNQDPARRVGQHRNVIAAAKAAGVKRIVFTSVQGTDSAPDGSVGASFLQTEDDLKNSGMKWAIGRNGVYIEPDVEYVEAYAKLGEIVNSAGDGRCGYTTRTELGLLLWNTDPAAGIAAVLAFGSLFAINVLLPALPAYWLLVKKKN